MLNKKLNVISLEGSVVNVNSLKNVLYLQNVTNKTYYVAYKGMLHVIAQCDDSYCITTYDNKMRLYVEETYFEDLQTIVDCLNEM